MAPSEAGSSSSSTSKAGITTDPNGQRHIPSSVRADGSVRKEIRIRPGYRPPEDVELYKNRTAEAFRNRGKGAGVPGAEFVDGQEGEEGLNSSKNAKKREAKKRAAAAAAVEAEKEIAAKALEEKAKEEEVKDPEAEKEKEAKKLLKKLRQARELKDKKDSGAALLPEQFEKVIRINELIRQLGTLGFSPDGEKKQQEVENAT